MINLKAFQVQADKTLAIVNNASAAAKERKDSNQLFQWFCLQLMMQANVRDLVTIGRMVAKGASHNALKGQVSKAKALSSLPVITFTSGSGKNVKTETFTKAEILASDKPLFSVGTVYAKIRGQTETQDTEMTDDDIVRQQISAAGLSIGALTDDEYDQYLTEGKLEIAEQEKTAMLENIPSLKKELEQKLSLLRSVSPDTFAEILSDFAVNKQTETAPRKQAHN